MRRHLGVVGGYRASLAVGAEILRRIKAERRRDAHRSGPADLTLFVVSKVSPNRLRGVFYQAEMEFVS